MCVNKGFVFRNSQTGGVIRIIGTLANRLNGTWLAIEERVVLEIEADMDTLCLPGTLGESFRHVRLVGMCVCVADDGRVWAEVYVAPVCSGCTMFEGAVH